MGLFDSIFGSGGVSVPSMGPEEKAVLANLTKLAEGDEELGQMYVDFTKRALKGEVANPYLEKQLERETGLVREDIARRTGALGDIAGTAGRETMGRLREAQGLVRAEAGRRDIGLGEQLLASRTGRLTTAGTPVLSQFGLQRQMQLQADIAEQQQAGGGLPELIGGAAGGFLTGRALGVDPLTSAGLGALGSGSIIPFVGAGKAPRNIYGTGGRAPLTTGANRYTVNPEQIGLRR